MFFDDARSFVKPNQLFVSNETGCMCTVNLYYCTIFYNPSKRCSFVACRNSEQLFEISTVRYSEISLAEDNVVCEFLGVPEIAQVLYRADNSTCMFKLGDCVHMSPDD